MTFLRPTVFLAAFSTTGKSPVNGKTDTCAGVRVGVEEKMKTWVLPFKSATMNQAALLGLKFGIVAISTKHRDNLLIKTDSKYVERTLEQKNGKFSFKPESNIDLVTEIRDMISKVNGCTVTVAPADKDVAELREKIRVIGKKRLA